MIKMMCILFRDRDMYKYENSTPKEEERGEAWSHCFCYKSLGLFDFINYMHVLLK